jgi:two-component system, chemotaxis family, protein-glutamate methylesterase/glutaminase
MAHRDIVVMGASAGGVETLSELVRGLPKDLPAAVFIVMHMSAHSPGSLASVLGHHAALPVHEAVDGEPIRNGHIYVARPDRHLMLQPDRVRVVRGPKQNRYRPSVDVLFQSSATSFGPRVIGVVLTGNLDDGTAGLKAIKDGGGFAVVQDPRDATFPGMPQSAAKHVAVDLQLPLATLAAGVSAAVRANIEEPKAS